MNANIRVTLLAILIASASGLTRAAEPVQAQRHERFQEEIFGAHLMTPQERLEYRRRMRRLPTQQERWRFRHDHQERMLERAKARGVALPEGSTNR